MIKKADKNKLMVNYLKDHGEIKKGTIKLIRKKRIPELMQTGTIEIIEEYKPADVDSLKNKVEELENTIIEQGGLIEKLTKEQKKEQKKENKNEKTS